MKRLFAAVALTAFAAPAIAQTPSAHTQGAQTPSAQTSSAQAPAGITLQQLQDQQWAGFSMLDTDKDGRVSRAEWNVAAATAPGQLTQAAWDKLDANKDGYITREEFNARVAARFALMDTNHDNLISAQEMQAAQAEAMKQMQAAQPAATPQAPARPPT